MFTRVIALIAAVWLSGAAMCGCSSLYDPFRPASRGPEQTASAQEPEAARTSALSEQPQKPSAPQHGVQSAPPSTPAPESSAQPATDTPLQDKAARVAAAEAAHYPHWAKRLAVFLDDTPGRTPGGVVFLGDSITEGFPIPEAFPGQNVINRGISGDTITGLMDRMDVSVEQLHPRRVYLLIGINDIVGKPDTPVEEFARQYEVLLKALKKAAPDAEIYVQSVLPVCRRFAPHGERVKALNAHIRRLAESEGLPYVDLYHALADENGQLREQYTSDGVHLTIEGYWAWLEVIVPPDDLFAAAESLAPLWARKVGDSYPIDAVDPPLEGPYGGNRGPNQLIVYTPASGRPTTQTNEWGCEAVVVDGVVTAAGGNNSPIPANGFVVSGHGDAAQWVSTKLITGARVSHDGKRVRVQQAAHGPQTPWEIRRERLHAVFRRLNSPKELSDAERDALRAELLSLQK